MVYYTALRLIDIVFDFNGLTRDPEQWNEQSLADNPPRLIRLQQIEALLNAFDIKPHKTTDNQTNRVVNYTTREKLEAFFSGDFIQNRTLTIYKTLLAAMNKGLRKEEPYNTDERVKKISDLSMAYWDLLRYKRTLYTLTNMHSGWMEGGSPAGRFSYYVTKAITQKMVKHTKPVDDLLELFINPKQLLFTEEELIARYHFPTDSVDEADEHYM